MLAFLRNVFAALLCALFGAYLLRTVPGYEGSIGGALLVLLALFIAFPTQMQTGLEHTRAGLTTLLPVIIDLLPGKRDRTAQQRAGDMGTPNPPAPQVEVHIGTPVVVASAAKDADKGGAQ